MAHPATKNIFTYFGLSREMANLLPICICISDCFHRIGYQSPWFRWCKRRRVLRLSSSLEVGFLWFGTAFRQQMPNKSITRHLLHQAANTMFVRYIDSTTVFTTPVFWFIHTGSDRTGIFHLKTSVNWRKVRTERSENSAIHAVSGDFNSQNYSCLSWGSQIESTC